MRGREKYITLNEPQVKLGGPQRAEWVFPANIRSDCAVRQLGVLLQGLECNIQAARVGRGGGEV
jgi:hypothetical protein